MHHNYTGGIGKHAVALVVAQISAFAVAFWRVFWQDEGIGVALLAADEFADCLDFGGVHKTALDPNQVISCAHEHVTTADQLIRSACI